MASRTGGYKAPTALAPPKPRPTRFTGGGTSGPRMGTITQLARNNPALASALAPKMGQGAVNALNNFRNTNTQYKPAPSMGTTDAVRAYLAANPQWDNGTLGPQLDAFDARGRGTPAAPAAPDAPATQAAPAAAPKDSTWLANTGKLNYDTGVAVDDANTSRVNTLLDYGYKTNWDDNGNYTEPITVDPNNPYSKAALLQRSYDQQKARTGVGYAARGQGWSGSMVNAQDQNTQGFQQSREGQLTALQRTLLGLTTARKRALDRQQFGTIAEDAGNQERWVNRLNGDNG